MRALGAALTALLLGGASAPLAIAAGPADPAAAARGAYLAGAAGCDQCHTDAANGGASYAGGRVFAGPQGAVASPNITPDRETGIGRWTLADFSRAMRWGVAPDDSHYLPVFPFPFYNRLTDADLADLKAFLDTVPPASRRDAAASDPAFSTARPRAALAVLRDAFPGPWRAERGKPESWSRGAYLVASIGRCAACHSPRDAFGAVEPGRFLAGAVGGPGGRKVPNITPDPETGIGKWSEEDVATLLRTGQTPDFDFVGGSMAEIVKSTAKLTDSDREAIAVYLKSLPPLPGPGGG